MKPIEPEVRNVVEKIKPIQAPTKVIPSKKISRTNVGQHKAPTKEIKTETNNRPKMHSVLLLVGTSKGTRGLPVLWNKKKITETGAKKNVELPIGSHTLEILHPDTL